MRKLALASLCLLVSLVAGSARAQPTFNPGTQQSVQVAGTVAAAAVLVTGIPNQRIYVTAVYLAPLATSSVLFTQGTGAGCGTGTTNVTGTMVFTTGNQPLDMGGGTGAVMVLLPGNSLCITIGVAAAPGWLAFAQF